MFKILRIIKNIFSHIRSSLKLIITIAVAAMIVIGIILFFYKPTYEVTLDGEFIGYTDDKNELQKEINEYMKGIEEKNIAFVDIDKMPEYSLCFVKRENKDSKDEILAKITGQGTTYYEYYAITLKDEEKYYVATLDEGEEAIDILKKKDSSNIKDIAYTQVYNTELKEYSDQDTIVAGLYKKKVYNTGSGAVYGYGITTAKLDLPIALSKPISSGYTITSRFGPRASGNHSGLDVACPTGTPIYAAASGTVTAALYNNTGYGYHIQIDHGSGVATLYGHCSSLAVTAGQYVEKGQYIGAVGSTGNSTGPHLHFEIKIDGTRVNPQYYLY